MGLTCGFIFKILKYHQSFQILHFRRKNIFTHKTHIKPMWYNAMNCNLNNKIVCCHSHAVNTHSNEDCNTHGIGTAQLGIVIYIYIHLVKYSQLSFIFPRAQSSLVCVTSQTSVILYIWYCVIQTRASLKQMVSQFLAKTLCRCYIKYFSSNMPSFRNKGKVHPKMKVLSTLPHVRPNTCAVLSMEHKRWFY